MSIPALTASTRKLVASLDKARHRRESGLFAAEGTKCVLDTAATFPCRMLLATPEWIATHRRDLRGVPEPVAVTRADLERMSHLSTPPDVMGLFALPEPCLEDAADPRTGLVVALDRIQDPGNLGTIVRLCDWYGVTSVIASADTADIFSPKSVQATMGSLARVTVYYTELTSYMAALPAGVEVCGTFLGGADIYTATLPATGVLVMGNEGRGISPEVERAVSRRLTIPRWPDASAGGESLNVGVATAICLSEFRRRLISK